MVAAAADIASRNALVGRGGSPPPIEAPWLGGRRRLSKRPLTCCCFASLHVLLPRLVGGWDASPLPRLAQLAYPCRPPEHAPSSKG